MKKPSLGLTPVATDDLRKLLQALHRGHLAFPLAIENLTRVGLQHCATLLTGQLRELDERGVRAVLVAVIAERMRQEEEDRARRLPHEGGA